VIPAGTFKLRQADGSTIPKVFIKNFNEERANGFARENVLGYYEGDDLPFFEFLAKNYAYCERFFCSHPGPTLPNRMFSLGGDVQYDRTGEAILNNNNATISIFHAR
jgi:phospholipase C